LAQPTTKDFQHLLDFRVSLRMFQRWSQDQAAAVGLTHVQHQLLVAVKGHPGGSPPTMGEIAGYLMLRPHSAVELVDRAEAAGIVRRSADQDDGRVVRVELTSKGDQLVTQLTRAHLAELRKLAATLSELVAAGP
jgi:DNA-binding MarR family transcriptional regulator